MTPFLEAPSKQPSPQVAFLPWYLTTGSTDVLTPRALSLLRDLLPYGYNPVSGVNYGVACLSQYNRSYRSLIMSVILIYLVLRSKL